jgi:pilus assembly protein Flp/PilA
MKEFGKRIHHFLKCEDGPTAVEYAVLLSLIVATCLFSIKTVGNETKDTFNDVGHALKGSKGN